MIDPSAMLAEVTSYFSAVCVTSCRLNTSSASREYVYRPDLGAPWSSAWDTFRIQVETSGSTELRRALSHFRFWAWSYDACPYPAEYCIAFPGIDYFEGLNSVCIPQLNDAVAQEVGARLSGWLQDLSQLTITAGASEISGLALHSDLFFLVAVMSVVIGLTLMVLLRFCVKPMVLAVIMLVFLLLLLGGAACIIRARQCADMGFVSSLTSIASAASDTAQSAFHRQDLDMNATSCTSRGGYVVRSKTGRDILKVCGFSLFALSLLWTALIAWLWGRIQLAIAASQVAAMFVFHTPQVLLVPIAQIVIGVCWTFIWSILAAFVLASVPSNHIPSEAYRTEAEASGTDEAPGACNSQWPAGFAWRDELSCVNSTGVAKCWRCAPPRYSFDSRFAYAVFSLLWHNALFIAVGQCVIAGATAVWFFAPRNRKARQASVLVSSWRTVRFHLGSISFGSLILACVQFLKLCMYYLSRQAQAHKNACAELVFKIVACCLGCFERCIKFLNKNAYIQVALRGTNFCTSAKNAFSLLTRNCVRFGSLAVLGWCIRLLGSVCIVAATGLAGYFSLQAMYPEAYPVIPVLIFLSVGYVVGKLTMNVFALALDTTMHCFIITEEMHHREGDFVPAALRKFVREQDLKSDSDHSSCCACAPSSRRSRPISSPSPSEGAGPPPPAPPRGDG